MLKATVLVSALALCVAIPARAESAVQKTDEASRAEKKSLPDEVVGYTSPHRSAGVIAGDAPARWWAAALRPIATRSTTRAGATGSATCWWARASVSGSA